jgi:hypothetical protein
MKVGKNFEGEYRGRFHGTISAFALTDEGSESGTSRRQVQLLITSKEYISIRQETGSDKTLL